MRGILGAHYRYMHLRMREGEAHGCQYRVVGLTAYVSLSLHRNGAAEILVIVGANRTRCASLSASPCAAADGSFHYHADTRSRGYFQQPGSVGALLYQIE